MDAISGTGSLSLAELYALNGSAMPAGGAEAVASPALVMEAAAMATGQALVATLLNGMPGGGSGLATALASLNRLDPSAELARLTR